MHQTQQETLFTESVCILCTSAYCSSCLAKNNLFVLSHFFKQTLATTKRKIVFILWVHTVFYKKLRSGPSTESFLAFGDLEYSKFLNSFLTSS